MSWLTSFLHPGRGYKAGQEQLDKYYNEAQNAISPYNMQGQDQYGNLNSYIQNFMDPETLQSKWASDYAESPAAIQAEKMAQQHGLDAANSMGLMGSNTALNAIQSGTSQIGMQDRQKYLDDLMQKYLAGAQLAQGIYGTGAGAANTMSQNAMNMGQNSADMAYGQQNAGGNMFAGLLGQGIGAVGGPIGSALATRWNLSGGK